MMMENETRERLQGWLRDLPLFGNNSVVVSLESMAGGQSSELLRAKVAATKSAVNMDLVIRLEQRGRQLFLSPDIAREFRILHGVGESGRVPVPAVLGLEDTGEVLGTPFLVMSHVEGTPLLGRPSMHCAGPLPDLSADQRHAAATNGLKALAAIHAIDWRRSHPFLIEPDERQDPLDRHLARLAGWYTWATAGRPHTITDLALEFLRDSRRDVHTSETVLLWGDARPGNILFDRDQNVSAVIDWEGAFTGPRTLDVAYWLMSDLFHADAIGVRRLPGWPDEAETIDCYEKFAGAKLSDIDYFIVMAAFFMGTTLIRATNIGIDAGRLPTNSRMGMDNSLTQIIAQRLDLSMPPLSSDFIRHRGLPKNARGLAD